MLSGLMTLGLVCFGGIWQGSLALLLSREEGGGGVTVPTRERKKKMMIKYFTKYKEQFRASGGPSKMLLRLDMPGAQLPTMWLQGKVWVPEEPGRWNG